MSIICSSLCRLCLAMLSWRYIKFSAYSMSSYYFWYAVNLTGFCFHIFLAPVKLGILWAQLWYQPLKIKRIFYVIVNECYDLKIRSKRMGEWKVAEWIYMCVCVCVHLNLSTRKIINEFWYSVNLLCVEALVYQSQTNRIKRLNTEFIWTNYMCSFPLQSLVLSLGLSSSRIVGRFSHRSLNKRKWPITLLFLSCVHCRSHPHLSSESFVPGDFHQLPVWFYVTLFPFFGVSFQDGFCQQIQCIVTMSHSSWMRKP